MTTDNNKREKQGGSTKFQGNFKATGTKVCSGECWKWIIVFLDYGYNFEKGNQ